MPVLGHPENPLLPVSNDIASGGFSPGRRSVSRQFANGRLGGGVAGQGVQVSLDDDRGRFFVHGQGTRRPQVATAILSVLLIPCPAQ